VNTKRVNTAADVILAALTQNRTAAGIATALESAQLLMSPETAAELRSLRDRVAELQQELAAKDRPADEGPIAYALTEKATADGLTRTFAPVAALREHTYGGPPHHDYRLGRDLPQAGA
jgi:hypothetical protein